MGEMELRPYQREAREKVHEEWNTGRKKTLLVLPTGCHAKGQQLLTASGKTTCVEKIRKGDRLLGADGKARTVLHITQGQGQLYQVLPIKGSPFIVTGDHKLTLVRTNLKSRPRYPSQEPDKEPIDVTVEEWIGWPKHKKHIYKLIRSEALDFPDYIKEKPVVSPYFVGILLGDGGLTQDINVTTPDPEVAEVLRKEAQRWNMCLRSVPAGNAQTYHFISNDRKHHHPLKDELVQLGIKGVGSADKSIPDIYKLNTKEVRLQLLAGLIDSDGSYSTGVYDFISKSKQLAEDVVFVARSLGFAAYINSCTKSCNVFIGTYFRVCISGDISRIPCKVARKKAGQRRQKKSVLRTGFSIKPFGYGDYFGFTVDGDNRYLMDDFTITHNCGKTIVFSKIAEDQVRAGDRVLILAHRGELLDQARDKLFRTTGLQCAVEKAEESCRGSWYRVVVGSVQTLMREKRLNQFPSDYFGTIIVDEAHHSVSDSYQTVLQHFPDTKVLGVTATPDRSDLRNLGQYFESLAYEYTLPKAIRDGYLCPIRAQTIPLKLDLSGVGVQSGDFKAGDLGTALDPYLDQIADEMANYCKGRKTVVFLPLVKTSQKFRDILKLRGFNAAEVNGESQDRAEVLRDFDAGRYDVLCNSMLLTEGWDCPSVDCIVVLRPTKVRSLYSQMVGRGTRLCPGKDHLLLLDFLWHSERHELCHPASLICETAEVAKKATENIEAAGEPVDLIEAEETAKADVVAQREEALAKALAEMKHRKRQLVDPLQFEMSIQAEDLTSYFPSFAFEMAPPSQKQIEALEKYGIFPDEIDNAGKATILLNRLAKRREEGLTTPKQIRFLEGKGFQHVGTWSFDSARKLIDRIAGNGWRVPYDIIPAEYRG